MRLFIMDKDVTRMTWGAKEQIIKKTKGLRNGDIFKITERIEMFGAVEEYDVILKIENNLIKVVKRELTYIYVP